MAAHRANWKGFIKVGEVSIPVGLYSAATTSERISFHMLNRATGNRIRRHFVDQETGKAVDRDDQVKGYEVSEGDFIVLEDDDIASAIPDSDKTLSVHAFLRCSDIDDVYFDKPYYLLPSQKPGEEAFALLREGMRAENVAALAQTVLFRRLRTVLIRAEGRGLIAATLNFDYEVRAADAVFDDIDDIKINTEMMDLAKHIIETKRGSFDPAAFDDRYEAALTELVEAKIAGRAFKPAKPVKSEKVVDLMDALRRSADPSGKQARKAGASGSKRTKAQPRTSGHAPASGGAKRKAG